MEIKGSDRYWFKKNNKISIEQKLISLNLTQTYKATENSENLILSDAVTIHGSSNATNIYYGGQKFYQLDHTNGFTSLDSYADVNEKINILKYFFSFLLYFFFCLEMKRSKKLDLYQVDYAYNQI